MGARGRHRYRWNGHAYRDSLEHGRTEHSEQGEEEAQLHTIRKEIYPTNNHRPADRKCNPPP